MRHTIADRNVFLVFPLSVFQYQYIDFACWFESRCNSTSQPSPYCPFYSLPSLSIMCFQWFTKQGEVLNQSLALSSKCSLFYWQTRTKFNRKSQDLVPLKLWLFVTRFLSYKIRQCRTDHTSVHMNISWIFYILIDRQIFNQYITDAFFLSVPVQMYKIVFSLLLLTYCTDIYLRNSITVGTEWSSFFSDYWWWYAAVRLCKTDCSA